MNINIISIKQGFQGVPVLYVARYSSKLFLIKYFKVRLSKRSCHKLHEFHVSAKYLLTVIIVYFKVYFLGAQG